jgi:carboxyl-terminal processing protease
MTSLLVVAAFLVGLQVNERNAPMKPAWAALASPGPIMRASLDDTGSLKPVQLYQEALSRLQSEYVEPIQKPEELSYAAIRGMLYQLNDPYTRYMDPEEYKDFRSDNQGHFAGIGATLNMQEVPAQEIKSGQGTMAPVTCPVCGAVITNVKHYRVEIVEPLPKSPAEAAGLKPHDIILKVDDKATDGMTVSEVASLIRGKEGTPVTLTLHRMSVEKPLTVTITRAQIEVPAVQTKTLEDNIGYLHLLSFNEKTVEETADALQSFKKAGAKGIVLDLRNNPGGLLTECIKVASMLLPDTKDKRLIVWTKSRGGDREDYNRIYGGISATDIPMVVLVNKGSASASEILSGCLKDYKRATIVGESTFGKALVQTVIPLSEGAMAVTTAHYYTPSGYDVGKKGVAPDVAIELEKGATISEKDNQAVAAIRLLKDVIAKK